MGLLSLASNVRCITQGFVSLLGGLGSKGIGWSFIITSGAENCHKIRIDCSDQHK